MLMPRLINKSVLNLLMVLLILALILSSIYGATSSDSNSLHWRRTECPENSSDISGSAFEASLNDSFSQLLTNTSSVVFSNVTKGAGEDQVYALFYCKGDVDLETCQDCVEEATKELKDSCKFAKEGIVWYEECTLRYANRTFFSVYEVTPNYPHYNRSGIFTEIRLDSFQKKFDDTMEALVKEAAYGKGSLPGFATKEFNLSSTEIIRGLAQCTPDIVGLGCESCLKAALRIRDTWANTIMFLPSCFLRYDLYETGAPPSLSPPPPTRRGKNHSRNLIIALSVAFIVLTVIGCAWLWIKKRPLLRGNVLSSRDINTPTVRPITPVVDVQQKVQGLRKYTYSQVKQMTNNFTVELGRGGYGVVYRGTLLDDTKEVAVKVLNQNESASEQFTNEIYVLTGISHRNIVSLLGHCQDKNRLALIYEFMDKGDLRSLLSGNPGSLSWRDRLKIAIDTAEGLDYLHYHSNDRVVHRDVKPANILLNGDLQAKLVDFGSSKIFPKDATTVKTQVVHSFGYTEPEYFDTGMLNMKADVYSFGIVLVELITGKVPSLEFKVAEWFVNALNEGDLDKIMDPKITRDLEDGSVWEAIELARECVKTDETEKPNMSEVVATLKKCLDREVRRNAGNSDRASTSIGIMNATNSDSISMVPDVR
ncbi:cysteine-rich receptor-like protein kinase 25 [Silene latifolia]|uniref:cysteine-rich receptor-like protein kinase 25 n=1 Tax=Silene latifolia TaxID=37657 RepID=UPI003D770E33